MALAIEAILTMLLVTVILGTAERARIIGPNAALAVASTIILAGLIALPVEGASMNPARSIGPALVAGRMDAAWIYILGPLLGATVAVSIDTLLHGAGRTDPQTMDAAQGDGASAPAVSERRSRSETRDPSSSARPRSRK